MPGPENTCNVEGAGAGAVVEGEVPPEPLTVVSPDAGIVEMSTEEPLAPSVDAEDTDEPVEPLELLEELLEQAPRVTTAKPATITLGNVRIFMSGII